MTDDAHATPADDSEDPMIAHGVVVGSVVGVIVSFIGATVGMALAGVELGGAFGFGLFVSFWGGLGFGSMMGGVLGFLRATEAEAEAGHAPSH